MNKTIGMKYLSNSFLQLLYCALILIAIPGSPLVFFLVSLAMSIIAGKNIFKYVKNPASVCFFNFFATSILLAYALSTLTTQIKIYSLKSMDVAQYFYLGQSSLSMALAAVALASAMLVGLGNLFPTPVQLPGFDRKQLKAGLAVAFIVVLASIYCVLTGLMAFQGLMFTDAEHSTISPLASMVSYAIGPAGVLAIFLASGKYEMSQVEKWVLYTLAAILWLVTFTQGRRLLVYLALLYLIFYAFNASGKFIWRKKLIFAVIVGFFGYLGVKLFFAFRVAGWESPGTKDAIQLIYFGLDILNNPARYDFDYLLSETSLERPFVIKYLSQLIEKVNFDRWFFGEAAYATLLFSIPSAFIGAKSFLIDEELIHPRLGLPIDDDANTVITTGVADFGWAGMVLYPVLVMLVLICLIRVVRKSRIKWLDYFTQFGVLFLLLNVECSMASYWSFVRSTLIVLIVALASRWLMSSIFVRPVRYS